MSDRAKNLVKNKSYDRILVLAPVEGQSAINSSGVTDKRLFSGENNLHCVMDKQTCLWHFHLDHGIVANPFKQQFTSFPKALAFAKDYYTRRNVEVTKVID